MAAMNVKHGLRLLALSAALALVGCGGDDEEGPPVKPDSGSILDPDDAGDDEPDAEEDADAGADDDGGSDGGEEDPLQASAAEAKKNGWVEGCYKKPTKNEELLNSCAANWRRFDAKLYPASWKEGEALPALP